MASPPPAPTPSAPDRGTDPGSQFGGNPDGNPDDDTDGDPVNGPHVASQASPLPLSLLERAINQARQAQPAQGFEAALAADVSLLGRVYGRLIWRRVAQFRADDLDDDERAALERWRG